MSTCQGDGGTDVGVHLSTCPLKGGGGGGGYNPAAMAGVKMWVEKCLPFRFRGGVGNPAYKSFRLGAGRKMSTIR